MPRGGDHGDPALVTTPSFQGQQGDCACSPVPMSDGEARHTGCLESNRSGDSSVITRAGLWCHPCPSGCLISISAQTDSPAFPES